MASVSPLQVRAAEAAPQARMPMRRLIGIWLAASAACVFLMLTLGGATRLTGSGLSIVEWQLATGILPPLSGAAWQDLFEKYQGTPQWQLVNAGMDLGGFQRIFWLEYLHRLVGRLTGVIFLVPFVYFVLKRAIEPRAARWLGLAFFLGALQGVVGWYMVKSGLVDRPHVSQYRLALHLLIALVIYGMLLWLALSHLTAPLRARTVRGTVLQRWALTAAALVFVTAGAGALVAGLHAGFVSSTFPLMQEQLVPEGLLALDPWLANFFENALTVQFQHRVLATLTGLSVIALWVRGVRQHGGGEGRLVLHLCLGLVIVQYTLGVMTIVFFVPKLLAAAHQVVACVLLTALLVLAHRAPTWPDRAGLRS